MGSGLYEAAFATAVRLHGQQARRTITGITLFAGFASTVGWPLTAWREASMGWREACLVWAGLHLVFGLPLNALLPTAERAEPGPSRAGGAPEQQAALTPDQQRGAAVLLAFVFVVAWFTSTAIAAHRPKLLLGVGASMAAAWASRRWSGRLIEFAFFSRAHPLLSARLATLAHPLGALCIGLFGSSAARQR